MSSSPSKLQWGNFPIKELYTMSSKDASYKGGIKYYKMPKQYASYQKDSIGCIGNTQLLPKRKITKKHNWLGLNLKEAHHSPSSATYSQIKKWPEVDRSKNLLNNKDYKYLPKKISFIDQIIKEKSKSPSPNKYNNRISDFKQKPQKDKDSKNFIQTAAKIHRETYIDDIEYLSTNTPGPGQYHPHQEVKKYRVNQNGPEYWIKKDGSRKNSPKRCGVLPKDKDNPDLGTYSPVPVTYSTFAKTWNEKSKFVSKQNLHLRASTPKDVYVPYPHSGFGLEIRFKQKVKEPKKGDPKRPNYPGPQSFFTNAYWPGKQDKPNGEIFQRNIYTRVSQRPEQSIYYESKGKGRQLWSA